MVQRSWFTNKAAAQYLAWKRDVANYIEGSIGSLSPSLIEGPVKLELVFHGNSNWNVRDLDNLIKGTSDALNPRLDDKALSVQATAWVDDRQVREINAASVYSDTPGIDITVSPLFSVAPSPYRAIGVYHARGVIYSNRIQLANSQVTIPARVLFEHDGSTTQPAFCGLGRNIGVLINPVDGAYVAFRTPEHAVLYLAAEAFSKAARRRTLALLMDGDHPACDCLSESMDGTFSPHGGFEDYLDHLQSLDPVLIDQLAEKLYVLHNADWAAVRPLIRRALVTTPVDEVISELATAGLPVRKKKKSGKKPK
jgi:Holliday junction resolvase RusA-like endonuclease